MRKIIKTLSILFFSAVILASCNTKPSIQEYYVQKQDNDNFIAIDIPASILKLEEGTSPETKETMSTIKKLNVLAFKINDDNKNEYKAEYDQIKEILKSGSYNELMRMKHENVNIVINYQGSDDAVDEFILFAADNNKGFALARVLGNKMNPEKIIKMTEDFKNIDKKGAGEALSQLTDLFGD